MTTLLEIIENNFRQQESKLKELYSKKHNQIINNLMISNSHKNPSIHKLNLSYNKSKINLMNYTNYRINELKQQNRLTHTIGFIILRHVNSEFVNQYWIKCYNSIRKYYPENHIIIIDDNSNKTYITPLQLYKTTIIHSEYPRRGELLPYYYYLHNKLFDTAVIIHDSVFINSYIDLTVDKYKILWEAEHDWDQIEDETKMITLFNDPVLSDFYNNKQLWKVCFGGMSIITHDYLTHINSKYDISKLLNCVLTRYNRISLERVIGCILQKEAPKQTLLGNIHRYCPYGLSINKIDNYQHLPIIKVWTGR